MFYLAFIKLKYFKKYQQTLDSYHQHSTSFQAKSETAIFNAVLTKSM